MHRLKLDVARTLLYAVTPARRITFDKDEPRGCLGLVAIRSPVVTTMAIARQYPLPMTKPKMSSPSVSYGSGAYSDLGLLRSANPELRRTSGIWLQRLFGQPILEIGLVSPQSKLKSLLYPGCMIPLST